MYRIDIFSDILLYKLYEKHVSSDEELNLTPREIASFFEHKVPINLIRSAIEINRQGAYEANRLMRRKGTKGDYRYDISLAGIEKIQNELRRTNSPIAYYSATSDLETVAGIHSQFMTDEERAQAESWKPLPIDRESPDFVTMRSSVVEAIEVIEKDNGLAVHFPEERAGILQTLKDGLEWITNRTPTKAQIRASLIGPLTWVITKFSDGIIAEASKKAATKIIHWLTGLS